MKPTTLKQTLYSVLLLITLATSSCIREDVPCCTCEVPYSETGAGTMGRLMDGRPWAVCDVAKKGISNSVTVSFSNSTGYNYYKIVSSKSFNRGAQRLFVHLWNPIVGLISITKLPLGTVTAEFDTELSSDKKGIYALDTSQYARLEVTKFDTIQRIISGRFECTLKRTGSIIDTTTIKVTNGVFDARF